MRPTGPSLLCVLVLAACGGGDLTLPGPGDPARLSIVAGDGQQGQPGEVVPDPLIVELEDGAGQPISGRLVAFRFLDELTGAAVDPVQATTDDSGRVAARARLGEEAGAQAIEAFVATPGEDLRVRFGLTAMAPPGPGGGDGGVPPPPGGGGGGGGNGNGGGGDDGGGGNVGGGNGGGGDGGGGGGVEGGGGGNGGGGNGGSGDKGKGHDHHGGKGHGGGHGQDGDEDGD